MGSAQMEGYHAKCWVREAPNLKSFRPPIV